MRLRRRLGLVGAAVVCAAVAVLGAQLAQASPGVRVPRYSVFDQAVSFATSAANRWDQVTETVDVTGPDGRTTEIGGFYAGSNTWTFRFAPWQLGRWSWTAHLRDRSHAVTHHGNFVVVPGGHGFV